jgi:3-oxoadipate enol-lactonase
MDTLLLDDGLTIAYRVDGPPDGPPLVFSNSLGTNVQLWDDQVQELASTFRIVRYDTRGHGRSGVPNGFTTIERLGSDLLALLDHLGIGQTYLCGLSLGGVTAQWLAIHHPTRLRRLVLSNTAARIGNLEVWQTRMQAVASGGMAAILDPVLARFFSPAFRAAAPERVAIFAAILLALDPNGYLAGCAALRDADLRPLVGQIGAPTLVIGGSLDEATPPAQAEELHAAIPQSELAILAGAGHLANVEQPLAFNTLLRQFLLA